METTNDWPKAARYPLPRDIVRSRYRKLRADGMPAVPALYVARGEELVTSEWIDFPDGRYRVEIEPDEDPDTSWLDQPDFADERGKPRSFYGVVVTVERHDGGRGDDALWGIDVLDDEPTWMAAAYLGEVADQVLDQALMFAEEDAMKRRAEREALGPPTPTLSFNGEALELLYRPLGEGYCVRLTMRDGRTFDAEIHRDGEHTTPDGRYALLVRDWPDNGAIEGVGEPYLIPLDDLSNIHVY